MIRASFRVPGALLALCTIGPAACTPSEKLETVASGACLTTITTNNRAGITLQTDIVSVSGTGPVNIEEDYLPHVLACEMGPLHAYTDLMGAHNLALNEEQFLEALKAQAVAARTALYYFRAQNSGSDTVSWVGDGESHQVFSTVGGCFYPNPDPATESYFWEAARQTRGQVLWEGGVHTAGFYVGGSPQLPPNCVGNSEHRASEHLATHNNWDGLLSAQPPMSSGPNSSNAGVMSTKAAVCRASIGTGYQDILRSFYGSAIEIVNLEASCGGEQPVAEPPSEPAKLCLGQYEPGQIVCGNDRSMSFACHDPNAPENSWGAFDLEAVPENIMWMGFSCPSSGLCSTGEGWAGCPCAQGDHLVAPETTACVQLDGETEAHMRTCDGSGLWSAAGAACLGECDTGVDEWACLYGPSDDRGVVVACNEGRWEEVHRCSDEPTVHRCDVIEPAGDFNFCRAEES